MKLSLTEQEFEKSWDCRNIDEKDIDALAALMLESYKGTIDYEGETLKDAISEVQDTFNGKYGSLLKYCSFVVEKSGQGLSACIICRYKETNLPLLAFSMTHPEFKNQGMATFLVKKSINALIAHGFRELLLFVSEGNNPARHLYEKVGFKEIDSNVGGRR